MDLDVKGLYFGVFGGIFGHVTHFLHCDWLNAVCDVYNKGKT